jgi:uncharacterized membrane protein YidH (DUF202 family)
MNTTLFDPGLQPERTELAWRRTTLSLAIGAIVALRILPPVLGAWSISLGFAGLAFTATIWILAARRAAQTRQALLQHLPPPRPATIMLLLSTTTSAGAALGLLYVTLH